MATFNFSTGDPNNLVGGATASMTDIQGPFVDLKTFINGQVGDSNLSASAAINENKLATGSNGLARGLFRVYRNAAQSVGTGATVNFDTEVADVSGWHLSGIYTPQVAGYYRLSWMVATGAALTVDNFWQASLFKNGVVIASGQPMNYRTAAIGAWSSGTDVVQANGTTDTFDVRVAHNQGGTVAVTTGVAVTYFAGELIGRS